MRTFITSQIHEYVVIGNRSVKISFLFAVVLICWFLYFFNLLSTPVTTSSQFNISDQTLFLLRFTVAIPYLIIWLSACYGFVQLKRYATSIGDSPEARAYQTIGMGMLVLLISLIVSTLAGSLRTAMVNSDLRPAITIIMNYLYVWPYLLAFILFYLGSKQLIGDGLKDISRPAIAIMSILFVVVSFLWLESIFTNAGRYAATGSQAEATYYLRDSLLILTIVIPSLIAWMLGIITVIRLRHYYHTVSGIIYQRAMFLLMIGFSLVIFGSILLQSVLSLGSQRIFYLGLAAILGIIYLFLGVQTAGYVLISRGAHKLARIEEV